MILGYASLTEEKIREGAAALARAPLPIEDEDPSPAVFRLRKRDGKTRRGEGDQIFPKIRSSIR